LGEFIAIEPRVLPEPKRNWKRINIELLPPCGLITRAMKLAVMDPANRDGELSLTLYPSARGWVNVR
jgi:hypothetical protein